jgi:uracil-DNA glycosylase
MPLLANVSPPTGLIWPPTNWVCDASWRPTWQDFLAHAAGQRLMQRLTQALAQQQCIYPPQPLRALALTPLPAVRVVIVGQDPYHQLGQANGLAFSVGPGLKRPPSLRNLMQEVARDVGPSPIADGQLEPWARQGVLLMNRVLTVADSQPTSHQGWGWEVFTDAMLAAVNALAHPVAFLLWGTHAQQLRGLIDERRHRVWTANHPSPLSARRGAQPFVGCGHFSAVNAWLLEQDRPPIEW